MTEEQLHQHLAAIENNLAANTAAILALNAIVAVLPGANTVNVAAVGQMLDELSRGQPVLEQLRPTAEQLALATIVRVRVPEVSQE